MRNLNLVTPLAHEATAMHITDTASSASGRSGAVSPVIGASLRQSDVDSVNNHSTAPLMRAIRAERKKEGLVELRLWLTAEQKERVLKYWARITKREVQQ